MTLEELKRRRRELGYTYQKLAELSGVPMGTLQKIFGGATTSPRYETMQALEKVLGEEVNAGLDAGGANGAACSGDARSPHGVRYPLPKADPGMFREEALSGWGKRQGEFTVADWETYPDDKLVELIDGVLYDMSPAPTYGHQEIVGEIFYQIKRYIRERGGRCRVLMAPFGVQLDRDDRTMVLPDVMILCRDEDLGYKWYHGAPDFIVEVLSPSTRRKDMGLKLRKYEAAGVREYWMVDIEAERVIVHVFGESPDVRIYSFDKPVPVAIYDGDLEIDLSMLIKELAELRTGDEPEDIIG